MDRKSMRKKKLFRVLILCITILNYTMVCFATGTEEELANEVLKPLYIILNLFIAVIQVLGVLQVVKFWPDLSNGIKDQDFTTGIHGAKGVAGGMALFLIRTFLRLMGVDWIE